MPTVVELKAQAKKRGFKRYSKLKKGQLITLLSTKSPDKVTKKKVVKKPKKVVKTPPRIKTPPLPPNLRTSPITPPRVVRKSKKVIKRKTPPRIKTPPLPPNLRTSPITPPRVSIKKHSNKHKHNKCKICLESLDKKAIKKKCGHTFHTDCIKNWNKINKKCPICPHKPIRQKLTKQVYNPRLGRYVIV